MRLFTTLVVGIAAIARCNAEDFMKLYDVQTSYNEDQLSARSAPAPKVPFDFNTALHTNLSQIPEVPITWIGAVEVGGPNVSITGSHHFVKNKLSELGAYWLQNSTRPSKRELLSEGSSELEKRWARLNYACHQPNYGEASCSAVDDEDWYIPSHYGNGICIAGPNACGRFACEYDSAVLLCSSGGQIAIPCSEFATNVNFIFETCFADALSGEPSWMCKSEGQAFYEDPYYNVLIKETGPGMGC